MGASYFHALDSDMTVTSKEEEIRRILTFVIVGGGPTGVELAGELTDFLHSEGKKLYSHLAEYFTIHMFTYDILAPFDEMLQNYALQHLRKKQGVQVHLGAMVTKVS